MVIKIRSGVHIWAPFLKGSGLVRLIKIVLTLLAALGISGGLVHFVALPVLEGYPRIAQTMARFAYTESVLILFLAAVSWLFYLQWSLGKMSIVYLYLFFSVYLFLLFVVLFTKAPRYHQLNLNPFDFIWGGSLSWIEAVLNVAYFLPLGLLYGMKAGFWEFVLVSLLTILGIETIQYVFYLGTFAVSDILLNFLGCFLGYRLYQPLHEHFRD